MGTALAIGWILSAITLFIGFCMGAHFHSMATLRRRRDPELELEMDRLKKLERAARSAWDRFTESRSNDGYEVAIDMAASLAPHFRKTESAVESRP